jgi:hypothetical protein
MTRVKKSAFLIHAYHNDETHHRRVLWQRRESQSLVRAAAESMVNIVLPMT